ncbi:hypothetical protein KUV85_04340 [Nocardioides panacisoli]|uniref:hypothetical protein n=1 Tax=Nocardioides panacisoli TaxID=627624 RepID=UPI001C631DFE|nr:hypothetical protein [Nocardioides panacisoli]QYJ04924.1 hypothetical protein KUV85_04340 [Nocardioides panacisoli]
MNDTGPAPRRKHLMDPSAPPEAPDPADLARLHRVQRIVISVLVLTTILHLSFGLVLAADHVAEDRLDAQVVLIALGTASMVLGVAAALAILRRPVLSPWLTLGLLPGLAGWWWVFLR